MAGRFIPRIWFRGYYGHHVITAGCTGFHPLKKTQLMRFRLLLFFFICSLFFVCAATAVQVQSAVPDSVVRHATLLAARGEVAELRPLFKQYGASFPRYARLYCDMALARADRRVSRMVACIDTLTAEHEAQLGLRGRISLSLVKAEALRQTGQYDRLVAYCREQLTVYKRRRVRKVLLEPFEALLEKGRRLTGNAPRTRALQCADRDDAFVLAEKYAAFLPSFDAYARLSCLLTMAEAYGRDNEAYSAADSLLTFFTDSLDTQDLTNCLRARAEVLIRQGRWGKLAETSAAARKLTRAHAAPLEHYVRVGEAFGRYAPTAVERPQEETAIPVSYVFPLLVKCRIGAGEEVDFRLDTGQAHTLLSEEDARRSGVHFAGDTISIPSWAGLIDVKPALVDELRMGGVVFRRLLVYVVLDSNELSAEFGRALGTNDLMRLKKIDFYDEKLVLPSVGISEEAAGFPVHSNLRLSVENTLRLQALCSGQPHFFSLDTGCDGIVLSRVAFPATDTEDCLFRFSRNGVPAVLEGMTLSEERAADHDGMLGTPFIRLFKCLHLDFRNMQVTADNRPETRQKEYDPFAPLALRRNFQALMMSAPEAADRKNLTRLLEVYEGKTAFRLESGNDRPQWKLPVGVRDSFHMSYDSQERTTLTGKYGKRKVEVTIALQPYGAHVVLSDKMARRLKVRFDEKDSAMSGDTLKGVLDRLEIGGTVLTNLRCLVCSGRGDTLRLGYEALALMPAVTFTPDGLTLHETFTAGGNGVPFAVADAVCLQGETPHGYAVLHMGDSGPVMSRDLTENLYVNGVLLPEGDFGVADLSETVFADAVVPLGYLVRKLGNLTWNFTQAEVYFHHP